MIEEDTARNFFNFEPVLFSEGRVPVPTVQDRHAELFSHLPVEKQEPRRGAATCGRNRMGGCHQSGVLKNEVKRARVMPDRPRHAGGL